MHNFPGIHGMFRNFERIVLCMLPKLPTNSWQFHEPCQFSFGICGILKDLPRNHRLHRNLQHFDYVMPVAPRIYGSFEEVRIVRWLYAVFATMLCSQGLFLQQHGGGKVFTMHCEISPVARLRTAT